MFLQDIVDMSKAPWRRHGDAMTESGLVVFRQRTLARGRALLPSSWLSLSSLRVSFRSFPLFFALPPVNRLSVSLATAAMTGDRMGLQIITAGLKIRLRLRSWKTTSGDRTLRSLTPTVATISARIHSRHSGGEQMSLTTSRLLRSGVVWTSMRWLGSTRIVLKPLANSSYLLQSSVS